MNKSLRIPLVLILMFAFISLANRYLDKGENVSGEDADMSVSVNEISHDEIDVSEALFRVNDIDNYFFLKSLNYHLMSYFQGINQGDVDMELFESEYLEFMNLDENAILKRFSSLENIDYDVLSYERVDDAYIAHLHFRDIGKEPRYLMSISVRDGHVTDRPYLFIEDVKKVTGSPLFSINVKRKAVFLDYEIYEIQIQNKKDEELLVDSGMYGFYAIKGNNKYYHRLESEKLPYELAVGENRRMLIRFDVRNPEEIYVNIEGREIRIL